MIYLKKKLFTALFVSLSASAFSQKIAVLHLTNTLPIEREDELVVLPRTFIESKLGKIPQGSYLKFSIGKETVAAQFDDLNGDGKWDEAALLYSFKANEKAGLRVALTTQKTGAQEQRAHARHKRKQADESFGNDLLKDSVPAGQQATDFAKQALPPFLTEGPAWENDKVGFRIYFDVRNGKDIWGKTTKAMVLDTVGVNPKLNYHEQSAWGMDVLKVGSSLGAGSLALKTNYHGKDTLIRLGGLNMGKIIYEKLSDGPLRAIIRLHYPEWKALSGQAPIDLTEEISIWGGQYFYESKVTAKHLPHGSQLITGIVNLKSKSSKEVNQQDLTFVFTYDTQSENKDNLGMAILSQTKDKPAFSKTPNDLTDIKNTYTTAFKIVDGKPVKFRFVAGWEESLAEFKNLKSFESYLSRQARRFNVPIIVQ